MNENLSVFFRTFIDLFSDLFLPFCLLGLTVSVLFTLLRFIRRFCWARDKPSHNTQKDQEDSKNSVYFDSDTYTDSWDMPDKKF